MSTTPSSLALQEIWDHLSSRRLLLHTPLYPQPAPPPSDAYVSGDHSFDANVVMVLSVLLCALICSLGLNSIIRCALRCSSFVASEPGDVGMTTSRVANTGIKKKALKTFPTVSYLAGTEGNDECVICLTEFSPGERLRILPKCNHGFHVRCIDRWLNSHSSCPTCRHCLIETCQKIVGCTTSNSHETVVGIVPLDPERLVSPYRT